jgi:hypothetical protein
MKRMSALMSARIETRILFWNRSESISSSSTRLGLAEIESDDDSDKGIEKKMIKVTFTEKTGEELTVKAQVGESLMECAHGNDIELEGLFSSF